MLTPIQMTSSKQKEVDWMNYVMTATDETKDVVWGTYNARRNATPEHQKSIVGTYPLQKESPNSHFMMRHTMNIAM